MKLKTAEERLATASATLLRLQVKNEEYTYEYFAAQWDRQKNCQLAAMAEVGTKQKLEKHLIELLDFEEKLKNAQ